MKNKLITYFEQRKREIKLVFGTCFLMGLVAHGFIFFNTIYSHDSVSGYRGYKSSLWAATLGRYFYPFITRIRGYYFPPTLLGFLSLLFVGISAFVIIRTLNITKKIWQSLIVGVMVTYCSLTLVYATYMHDADVYMFALLCSSLAAYFIRKNNRLSWMAVPFVWITCGLYQSYYFVTLGLILIFAILDLTHGHSYLEVIKKSLKGLGISMIGIVLYLLGLPIMMRLYGVELSQRTNSITQASKLALGQIPEFIQEQYAYFFHEFSSPHVYSPYIMKYVILAMLVILLITLIQISKRKMSIRETVLLVLLIILIPFVLNGIYILTVGVTHELMTYAFCLVYILFIAIISETDVSKEFFNRKLLSIGLLGSLIFSSVVYSNQIYIRKDAAEKKTDLVMNRILMHIEELDGFENTKTPIAFIGRLDKSEYFMSDVWKDEHAIGTSSKSSITYYRTYSDYLNRQLEYELNILDEEDSKKLSKQEEVKNMPCFPDKGFIKMIDGVVVVKISN